MRFSPTFRISFGLVLVTISILLTADLFGLTPNNIKNTLNERKHISEALAVEFTIAAQKEQFDLINRTLELIVQRNDDIVSAGLRNESGKLLSQNGNHAESWVSPDNNQSTVTHVIVPISNGNKLWGSVEIHFADIHSIQVFGIGLSPLGQLLLFVGLAGFVGYMFLIHRTLRYLNPSAVVPGRVQFALDALKSSVVLLNEEGEIVLSNSAFSSLFEEEELLGKKLEDFSWKDQDSNRALTSFPWKEALKTSLPVTGKNIRLDNDDQQINTYVVNCTPILDAEKSARGALISFEDISKIQKTTDQLQSALDELETTHEQVEKKNQELEVLASRDPMTGCLNRRSFFELLEPMFIEAKNNGSMLACIMTDIDHFKLVNDNHGHQVGDEVIKLVADILDNDSRSVDTVCRYGGEEFCILLPGLDMDGAAVIAEKIRYSIETVSKKRLDNGVKVTSSFGVSSTELPANNPLDMINLADQALYGAKENGRNKVYTWSEDLAANAPQEQEAATTNTIEQDSKIDSQQLITKINELQTIIDQQSQELVHQSAYDAQTGLPSRLLFEDRVNQSIAQAMRLDNKIVVISVAIEAFKRIHDTFGNSAAEELMKQASKRLAQVLRSTDTIAALNQTNNKRTTISRISPDEFGVLITDLETVEPVTWIIKRILNSLAPPTEINDNEISLNGYIGASLHPEDGDVAEILVNKSATARYHASQEPEGTHYKFYSDDLNEASVRLINLESQLHTAIENQELFLHYQPKINIASGKIIGLEALIRWKHPTRGFIPPQEFIPIAERSGLILDLGVFVLRSACEKIREWLDAGIAAPRVAVNLSPVQLRQPGLFQQVKNILKETGVEPHFLELEITEGTAMSCLESAIATTRQFQALGIRVSLDDFGTGFSSLNYLRLLPVDTLKIDRSFITDLVSDKDNLSIVAAIIAMSHKLGMTVLAEGVEYNNQYRLLQKLNCDEVQGYLVSMPIPPDEIETLLLSDFGFSVEEKVAALTH